MIAADRMRTIDSVEPVGGARLRLGWSDGVQAEVDLSAWLQHRAFAPLKDPAEFARVEVGDWGHSLAWPSGVEAGADRLWLETLSARKRDDTRAFLEWRQRSGLSLTAAAGALGLSRRMVAYYSNGEKPVPRTVLLACLGWEAGNNADKNKSVVHDLDRPFATMAPTGAVSIAREAGAQFLTRASRMKKHALYIERRPQGDYAVRRGDAGHASAVKRTQAEAIERAKELDPKATIMVERVRGASQGNAEKWRKA